MFRQNQDMIGSKYICESYDKSDKCEIEKQEINKEAKTDFSSESQIIKTEKSRSIVENESHVNSETDKISQETIKENFPFSTFLEDQLEILTEIVDAIEDGYKYIILESGVGKSAIAATLANIYESSFILSDNKKLQEKYHEEYDLINNDKFHVSNHSDAFNEFEKLDKRKLLIVDDAHKFDENIADFFSYKIHLSAFDDELIDSFYCDVRNKEKKEIDVGLDFINHLSLDDEMVNLIKYNIEENPDDWIWFYDKYYGGMIIFKPLNLENILKKYLLNKAEICIFMSSTVLNKEIFADELGLDISEVKFIHKDFPFSSDANQIYLRNCAAMNDSQNVKLVSPFIEYILEKHKNEKGIIHTDKPEYTSCIENQINNPRLFETEYKKEYYENRVDKLLKSLKTMSFDKALKRANISEEDYNRWYAKGKKQCLLKKDDDEFCLNFYINVTRVLMDRYLKLRSEGKTKTEACKKINTDLNEVKRWCKWNESGLFIDFKENSKKITADLIVDAIKNGKSKDKIAENSDITVSELNKILVLGSQNDKIYRKVYEEYESFYLSKHLDVFLKEIKNKNLKKALKTSGIEKAELDKTYNLGKNGDERFTKFYNDYLNFKISCYISQIIKGKTTKNALKNSNLTDVELKDNLEEIDSKILDKQMSIVIGEITRNRTTKQAAKKANVKIDEVYRWYLEGKKGNEKFEDFADDYHEFYVEAGCEIFQNFLSKGKTPEQIIKIMNEDITKEDYEFWIKNNLITDKNVEAKLYTEDEIKEKIKNGGFRQKEEKSLSGLSIICC